MCSRNIKCDAVSSLSTSAVSWCQRVWISNRLGPQFLPMYRPHRYGTKTVSTTEYEQDCGTHIPNSNATSFKLPPGQIAWILSFEKSSIGNEQGWKLFTLGCFLCLQCESQEGPNKSGALHLCTPTNLIRTKNHDIAQANWQDWL